MSKVILNITEEGRGGGAMGRMRMIALALRPNIDSIIVFPSSAKLYEKSLQMEQIKNEAILLHPLTKSPLGALKYLLFFLYEIYLLMRIIKKSKPDLIQANGCWQIKGVIAGKLTRTKVMWYMNDSYQSPLILKLYKFIAPHAFAFGHASHRTKEYYEKECPKIKEKMVSVITSPVNIESIKFVERERKEKIRFLTVGYINVHKGLEILINAASKTRDLKIEFDIVGPVIDSQKKYMKSLINLVDELDVENVNFLGFRSITTDLMAQYDYYLCSSIREASPMAVWEAMASGMPIVSTDVGDVKEVLMSKDCGILIKNFNAVDMAQAIKQIIELDDASYVRMSENAREVAEELFTVEKVSKDYLRFYTEIISEPVN